MRTKNFIRNFLFGAVGQALTALLSFAVRTVFIYTLPDAFVGINGLLSSLLSVLNLANLGIDGAIIYAMYRPLAENDTEKAKSLLRFYRSSFRIIGTVILAVGLGLTPFLDVFTHGGTDLVDLRIVYWLCLLETVSSYWFFAYMAGVASADQKNYLVTGVDCVVQFLLALARMGLLLLFRKDPTLSFYIYSGVGVVFNILRGIVVRVRVSRHYPWTRETDARPLTKEEKKPIFKNVVGMSTNNICRVLNDGIDSTIVSSFLGLAANGIFTNYLSLRTYVLQFLKIIFSSLTAGVGNLCVTESGEKKEEFFLSLQFSCFWIYGFCAICFWMLLDPFIAGVWLRDTKWLLPPLAVFLLSFNFLIEGLAKSVIVYRDANGLFWQSRYRYLFSSVFNAVISVVLVGPLHMGVTGALLGTSASLIIMISRDPVLVYREVLGKKGREYYRIYFRDLALVLLTAGAVWLLCLPFRAYTVGNFLLRLVICLVIPNGAWYLLFRKDPRFAYLRDTATRFVGGLRKKLGGGKA